MYTTKKQSAHVKTKSNVRKREERNERYIIHIRRKRINKVLYEIYGAILLLNVYRVLVKMRNKRLKQQSEVIQEVIKDMSCPRTFFEYDYSIHRKNVKYRQAITDK